MKRTWITDCNKQGEKSANHAYTYSISQNLAYLLCEKRGINKRNNFCFLLKVVVANKKNKANFGFSEWVGAVGEECAMLTSQSADTYPARRLARVDPMFYQLGTGLCHGLAR